MKCGYLFQLLDVIKQKILDLKGISFRLNYGIILKWDQLSYNIRPLMRESKVEIIQSKSILNRKEISPSLLAAAIRKK